ncbi:hypothetical protein M9H77_03755 [Catharanthus roseus]|uniref:Uncharacterized protein n=1 Tax=Catharanthus roseus TaxID=4058 RepID=A0ACC0CCE8_CATRO|nr:hypothetical protein M9H77_03755 [Catharanthus roseus]
MEKEFVENKRKPTSGNGEQKVPLRALVHEHNQDEMREFIKIFRQLEINLPLCDLLLQIPKYARHYKHMLNKKVILERICTLLKPTLSYIEHIMLKNMHEKILQKFQENFRHDFLVAKFRQPSGTPVTSYPRQKLVFFVVIVCLFNQTQANSSTLCLRFMFSLPSYISCSIPLQYLAASNGSSVNPRQGRFPNLSSSCPFLFLQAHCQFCRRMKIINWTASGREEQSVIPTSEEDRRRESNPASFPSIKKTIQTGMGTSSSQLDDEDDKANESYNPSDDEDNESSKEEENDLEENERAKEMSEEKQGNSIKELNVFEKRVEGRRSMEKELGPILEDLSISLSLNPSSLCYDVSLKELKSLLDSYNFQVSLIGDMCIITFKRNFFLVVPSMKNFLSSHLSLEDPLMSSSVMFEPSCYGLSNLDGTSLIKLNMLGFVLEFDRNSLQFVCPITSTRRRRHTKEFEGKGEDVGEKLILCCGD